MNSPLQRSPPRLENTSFKPFTTVKAVPVDPTKQKNTPSRRRGSHSLSQNFEISAAGPASLLRSARGSRGSFSSAAGSPLRRGSNGAVATPDRMNSARSNRSLSRAGSFVDDGAGPTSSFSMPNTNLLNSLSSSSFNLNLASSQKPDTHEVNLSARSFSEKMLVEMRDSVIIVGQNQIKMLTLQNDQLRRNINEVEAEMITLQEALSAKDESIHVKDREMENLEREILSMTGEMHKGEGRENAMNIASRQNTHLLRLLEQEEIKGKKKDEEIETLNMQLEVVRSAHNTLSKGSAEMEAGFRHKMIANTKRSQDLSRTAELSQSKNMELQVGLMEMERKVKLESSTIKEELSTRREKVYQLQFKLQSTEDKLRAAYDSNEKQQEFLESLNERNDELDTRLNNIRIELHEREKELNNKKKLLNNYEAEDNDRVIFLERENVELENKVSDLSNTVMQLVERHKLTMDKRNVESGSYQSLSRELAVVREGEQRLLESLNLKSRQFIVLEDNHTELQKQLKNLTLDAKAGDVVEELESSVVVSASNGKSKSKLFISEVVARRQMLENFLSALVEGKHTVLTLDDCNIDDVDMITVISKLKLNKTITELSLVSNRITDAGALVLAGILSLSNCKLAQIDLRNNSVSKNGVKNLAEALNNNPGRQIEHVKVHNDGKIEAIGAEASSSVCVIDVQDNFPNTLQPPPIGTVNTIWEKMNGTLPQEEVFQMRANKQKALEQRKKLSRVRDEKAATVYK